MTLSRNKKMPTFKLKNICWILRLLLLPLLLSSCGSGAGSSSASSLLNTGVTTSNSTLTLGSNVLQFSQGTTVTATLKKSDGTPVSGIPVTFATTLGSLTPVSGIATTDLNGVA